MSARYFFNIVTAAGTISDLEGAELSSLEEAREEAVWDARALMSVAILHGRDISSRSIEICNADQERLLLVAFREAISVTE